MEVTAKFSEAIWEFLNCNEMGCEMPLSPEVAPLLLAALTEMVSYVCHPKAARHSSCWLACQRLSQPNGRWACFAFCVARRHTELGRLKLVFSGFILKSIIDSERFGERFGLPNLGGLAANLTTAMVVQRLREGITEVNSACLELGHAACIRRAR